MLGVYTKITYLCTQKLNHKNSNERKTEKLV